MIHELFRKVIRKVLVISHSINNRVAFYLLDARLVNNLSRPPNKREVDPLHTSRLSISLFYYIVCLRLYIPTVFRLSLVRSIILK